MRKACLALFVASAIFALDDVRLQWKFEKGSSWKERSSMKMEIDMQVMGQQVHVTTDTDTMVKKSVVDLKDGNAIIESTWESTKLKSEGPQGVEEYDSTKDEEPTGPASQGSARLIGKTVRYTVTPEGKLIDLDEFKESIVDAFGEGQENMAETLKTTMEQSLPPLPDHPLKKGETWDQVIEVPISGTPLIMKMTFTYTYDGVETIDGRSCAAASISTDISMDASGGNIPAAVTMGEQKGKMLFDVDRGRVVGYDTDLTYEMTFGEAGPKQVIQKIHQVTSQAELPVAETK